MQLECKRGIRCIFQPYWLCSGSYFGVGDSHFDSYSWVIIRKLMFVGTLRSSDDQI